MPNWAFFELDLAVLVFDHDAFVRDLLDLGGRELLHVVVAETEHERVAAVEEGRRAELALHLNDGDVLPVHCQLKGHVATRDAAAQTTIFLPWIFSGWTWASHTSRALSMPGVRGSEGAAPVAMMMRSAWLALRYPG